MMRKLNGWLGAGRARHGPEGAPRYGRQRALCWCAGVLAATAGAGVFASEAAASTGARSALAPVATVQHDAHALGTLQVGELKFTAYADGRLLVDQLASMLASLGYGAAISGNSLHFADAHSLPTLRWHPGQIDAEFFPEGTGGRVSLRIDFFETGTRARSPLSGQRDIRFYEPAPAQVIVVQPAPPPPRVVVQQHVVHQPVYVSSPVVCRTTTVCRPEPICQPVVHTRSVVYRNSSCNEAVYRRPSFGPTVSIRVESNYNSHRSSHRNVCSSTRSFHRPHQPAFDSHISRSGPRGARPR